MGTDYAQIRFAKFIILYLYIWNSDKERYKKVLFGNYFLSQPKRG